MRGVPSTDEFVQAFLTSLRADTKKRTMFTSAGRSVQQSRGERIIYGPNGEKIRVLEDPNQATQVEQRDDKLHAVMRPGTVNITVDRKTGEIIR